jgi:hypothetical protein
MSDGLILQLTSNVDVTEPFQFDWVRLAVNTATASSDAAYRLETR